MPTIVNTYRSPTGSLGETLSGLGNTLFGKGPLEGDLLREKAQDSRRTNQSYQFLQDEAVRQGGVTPGFIADPRVQSALIGLPQPKEFFEANRGIQANTKGAMSPEATNSFVGAGGAYQNTGPGHMADLSNRTGIARIQADTAAQTAIRTAEMKPMAVVNPNDSRRVMYVSSKAAIDGGLTPILSNADAEGALKMRGFDTGYAGQNPQQQKAAGVLPPQDHMNNWVLRQPNGDMLHGTTADGRIDMITGQPLPHGAQLVSPANAGGAAAMAPMQPGSVDSTHYRDKIVNNRQLVGLIDRATQLVQNDPTIVGAPGTVQRYGQNAVAVARDLANAFGNGADLSQSINNMRADAQAKFGPNAGRIIPELFNPRIDELGAIHAIMVYKTAEMLGQAGKGASDRDVAAARAAVGDPNSLLSSSQGFLSRMAAIKQQANTEAQYYSTILQQGNINAPQMQPAPQVQPQQPAQVQPQQPAQPQGPASAIPVQTETWIRGPDGRPMRAR